jgi:hypothetical protein
VSFAGLQGAMRPVGAGGSIGNRSSGMADSFRGSATAAVPPPIATDAMLPPPPMGAGSTPPGSVQFDPSRSEHRGRGPGLQPFEIEHSELTFEKELGRGAYGIVYFGYWRDSAVAIKQLITNTNSHTFEKELKAFQDEAGVMKGLRPHVNVILLLGITAAPQVCIVAEFCFAENDHQVLTSRGFLYLDEVEAIVTRRNGVVVDWNGLEVANYDPRTRQLHFDTPRASSCSRRPASASTSTRRRAARAASAQWSPRATRCTSGDDDGEFRKVASCELVDAVAARGGRASMQLLLAAADGVASRSDGRCEPSDAVLELYGAWLCSGARDESGAVVTFAHASVRERQFVVQRLAAAGWLDRRDHDRVRR